jgi:Flp pilus assembly protein TadD
MRVNIALARNQPEPAINDLRTLLRDQPNSLPLRRQLARAYARNKQMPLAEDTLREALREKPLVMMAELAAFYEEVGRVDDAIAQYEQLHAKAPESLVAANNLAMILLTYRDDARSRERALNLSQPFAASTNPALLDTYGWALFKQARLKEAVATLQRATDMAPESPMLRYHLGMAQLQSGQSDSAKQNLQFAAASTAKFVGQDEARAAASKLKTLGK